MLLRSRSNVAGSQPCLASAKLGGAMHPVCFKEFAAASASSVGLRQIQLGSSNIRSSASPANGRSRRALTAIACTPPTYAAPKSERLVLDVGGQQVRVTLVMVHHA
eukprot:GHRQ01037742.1.p1 GENE.GHRQ01037742.1~~GHRQ01037742.1.p1  ORF type:complete len:106 (+),score=12.00 GHRQ01037742.1:75-392(+)